MGCWKLQCTEPPASLGGWSQRALLDWCCLVLCSRFWEECGALGFYGISEHFMGQYYLAHLNHCVWTGITFFFFFLVPLEFYSSPIFLLMVCSLFVLPCTAWELFHCSDTCFLEGKCNLFTCHLSGSVSPLTPGCCLLTVTASWKALYSLALLYICNQCAIASTVHYCKL